MKKKSLSILIAVAMTATTLLPAASVFADTTAATTTAPASTYGIEYEGHVQNIGWQAPITVTGDQTDITKVAEAGTDGKGLRVEAVKITGTNLPAGASITYQGHVQNIGWQAPVTVTGNQDINTVAEAGTDGKGLRVEAFKMTLNGLPGYAIQYRTHVENIGWQAPVTVANGTDIATAAEAGTDGKGLRMEALQIEIVKTADEKTAEVNAINAVNAAITSKTATDVQAATTAVSNVKDTVENAALTAQIAAINVPLVVTSVSAINASEIKVSFNEAVDSTTAENVANYTLTNSGSAAIDATTTPVLSSDAKSVTLKLSAPLANTNTYSVNVAGVLTATNYQAVTSYTDSTKLFYDAVAPTLLSSKYDGANVVLTFNKPVTNAGLTIKVDGTVQAGAVTASTAVGVYTLSVPVASLAAGTHTATVYNVADTAGNVESIGTVSFTTVADTTTPTVASITQNDYKSFKVAFNTTLNSLTAANFAITKAGYVIPTAEYAVTKDTTDDSTGKTYLVTFLSSALNDATNPLYGTSETAETLNVTAKNFQGTNANYGTSYTSNVTLSKTTAAPYIVSSNLNSVVSNVIKVKFNTALTSAAAAYVTVEDGNIIQPIATAAVDATDDTVLDLTLSANAGVVPNDLLTVSLQPNAVVDPLGNTNVATTTSVNNVITLTKIQPTNVVPSLTNANVITVTYGVAMADSAALASSYTLDGAALPSGTTVGFYGDNKTVQITLPAAYVPVNTSSLLAISTGVKSYTGTSVVETASATAYSIMVNLIDNVKPTITAAQYVLANSTDTSTSTIKLTFSEALAAQTAANSNVDDDFAVYVNGVKTVITNAVVNANDKTITFTTATPFNVSQPVTVSTVSGSDSTNLDGVTVTDVAGNKLTSGTTLTLTK